MRSRVKTHKILFGILLLGFLAFALPITILLVRDTTNLLSRAAFPDQLETESGILSSSGVTKQSHSGASRGSYVLFNKSSGPTPTPSSGSVKYTDYTLPKSHAGYKIDHTGSSDPALVESTTQGINRWVRDYGGGIDENNHVRLIFPATSVLRMNSAIHVQEGMDHTTFWGHAPTSSAWIRGDSRLHPDFGAQIRPESGYWNPNHSGFLFGSRYEGFENSKHGHIVQDIVVRGFFINGFHYTGLYPGGGYESNAAFMFGSVLDIEALYNKVANITGDHIRFRAGSRGYVHNNYFVNAGRMCVTATINYRPDPANTRADNVVEYNTFDRCGYWGIDIEPEDESDSSKHYYDGLIVSHNRFSSFGSSCSTSYNAGGGFAVIGGTATPSETRRVTDIFIENNVFDGYRWDSTYWNQSLCPSCPNASSTPDSCKPLHRSMWTTINAGVTDSSRRMSNFRFTGNYVEDSYAYSAPWANVVTAKYVDGLVITNNDANFAGSLWAKLTGSTNVTESNNK